MTSYNKNNNIKYFEFCGLTIPYFIFSPKGGTNKLVFECKGSWNINLSESLCHWLHLSENKGQVGMFSIKLEASIYNGEFLREGYITLTCQDEAVKIHIIQYPEYIPNVDSEFMKYILKEFDNDGDGRLSFEEAHKITSIDLSNKGMTSLEGIQYLHNLWTLTCSNNNLSSLDLSYNKNLTHVDCDSNQLRSLDVSQNTALIFLFSSSNQLRSLDVHNNFYLKVLYCDSNQLTSLDVSQNINLIDIDCSSNQLSYLDVSQNTELDVLCCENNQLTSLDVRQNTVLDILSCEDNQLTTLEMSDDTKLSVLRCHNNKSPELNLLSHD